MSGEVLRESSPEIEQARIRPEPMFPGHIAKTVLLATADNNNRAPIVVPFTVWKMTEDLFSTLIREGLKPELNQKIKDVSATYTWNKKRLRIRRGKEEDLALLFLHARQHCFSNRHPSPRPQSNHLILLPGQLYRIILEDFAIMAAAQPFLMLGLQRFGRGVAADIGAHDRSTPHEARHLDPLHVRQFPILPETPRERRQSRMGLSRMPHRERGCTSA